MIVHELSNSGIAGYERGRNAVGEENETVFGLQPNISRNGEAPVEE